MGKDLLYFSHANGFPAATYRSMLKALSERYEILATERIGHDPRFPVGPQWTHLVAELSARVEPHLSPGRSVWLVGHSLGGYLSLLAAQALRGRASGVVMLDSPLLAGWRAPLMRMAQWTGLDRRITPAGVTRHRRNHWPDLESVLRHFRGKHAFARWHGEVLDDYVEHGTQPLADGGRALSFEPRTEYRIYRTMPWSYTALLRGWAASPVGFIAGRESREVRLLGLRATRRLVGDNFSWIDGSHLYPMERPLETAQAVQQMIERLGTRVDSLHRPMRQPRNLAG